VGLVQLAGPTVEPLTVAEAAVHLRLDSLNVEPTPDAPAVALAGAGAGNVDNGAHRYRVTFVTADGETDGGDISSSVTVADQTTNGKVAVSGIPLGGALVTARKLYRTVAGGSDYFLVATIADNTTTTYTDNIADASLGAGVPSKNTTSDPYLAEIIRAAREYVEVNTNRALIRQQWRWTQDGFPPRWFETAAPYLETASGLQHPELLDLHRDVIRLPKPPLISVDAVTYVDEDGNPQTLDPSQYFVNTSGVRGEIARAFDVPWPPTRWQQNAVTVDFTCGYGSASSNLPAIVRQAMRLLVEHYYNNRGLFEGKRFAIEIPHSIDALLWQIRAEEAA
jgi:hypothetical protein